MPEGDGTTDSGGTSSEEQLNDDNIFNDPKIPQSYKDYLKKLRTENANKNGSISELKKKADDYDKFLVDKKKQEDAAAIQNGEAAKLLDSTKAELDAAKVETQRLKNIELEVITDLDTRSKALPKYLQDLMPEGLDTASRQKWIVKAEKSAAEAGNNKTIGGNMNSGKPVGKAAERETLKETARAKMIASGKYLG